MDEGHSNEQSRATHESFEALDPRSSLSRHIYGSSTISSFSHVQLGDTSYLCLPPLEKPAVSCTRLQRGFAGGYKPVHLDAGSLSYQCTLSSSVLRSSARSIKPLDTTEGTDNGPETQPNLPGGFYSTITVSGHSNVHFGDVHRYSVDAYLTSLFFPEMFDRYNNILDAAQGTCEWILEDIEDRSPGFTRWWNSDSPLFWISGKPGSGKSTLTKYLFEQAVFGDSLKEDAATQAGSYDGKIIGDAFDQDLTLSFWFWQTGSSLQRNLEGCVRSLLYQGLASPRSSDILLASVPNSSSILSWGIHDLLTMFKAFVATINARGSRIFLVLDALDECEDAEAVVALVDWLATNIDTVKICFASRPQPSFMDAFPHAPMLRMQDCNKDDIDKVIRNHFEQPVMSRFFEERNEDKSRLRQILQERAEGVFLWVILTIRNIRRGMVNGEDIGMLETRLQQLPLGLEELFEYMLSRQDVKYGVRRATTAMYLNLASHRTFNLIDFCLAVNQTGRRELLDSTKWTVETVERSIHWQETMKWITARSGGFLEVVMTSGESSNYTGELQFLNKSPIATIQFIHQTVRTFLQNSETGVRFMSLWSIDEATQASTCSEVALVTQLVLPGIDRNCVDLIPSGYDLCNTCNHPIDLTQVSTVISAALQRNWHVPAPNTSTIGTNRSLSDGCYQSHSDGYDHPAVEERYDSIGQIEIDWVSTRRSTINENTLDQMPYNQARSGARYARLSLLDRLRTSLAGDSGYVTGGSRSNVCLSDSNDVSLSIGDPELLDEDDTESMYSNDSMVSTQELELVEEFGAQFVEDFTDAGFQVDLVNPSFEAVENILADFALRLGQEIDSTTVRKVVKFIHKNRRDLAKCIESGLEPLLRYTIQHSVDDTYQENVDNTTESSDEEVENAVIRFEPEETIPILQKVSMWRQEISHGEQLDIHDYTPASYFGEVYSLVSATSSYRWLQSCLRRVLYTAETDLNHMQNIEGTVLNEFPRPHRISRKTRIPLCRAEFKVHWPLRKYIEMLQVLDPKHSFLNALTLTGVVNNTQALSCMAYIRQMWPENGRILLDLIETVLLEEQARMIIRKDQTHLMVSEHEQYIIVRVSGTRGSITEVAQQLCWLGAVLRTSENQSGCMLVYSHISTPASNQDSVRGAKTVTRVTRPRNPSQEDKFVEFTITFMLQPTTHGNVKEQNGTCWLGLFDSALIAYGFPIAGNRQQQCGVEMTLGVVARLVGTEFVDLVGGRLFLRGSSSMLVSIQKPSGLLMWHYYHTGSEKHISYFDHDLQRPSETFKLSHLPSSRHIVGWSQEIEFMVGAPNMTYQIQWSGLKAATPKCSGNAENDLNIPVHIASDNSTIITIQQRLSTSSHDDYPTIFRSLGGKFVLLWDVKEKRGWFVNALSTLLHLMRSSFQLDRDKLYGHSILKLEDLREYENGSNAAKQFLSDETNLCAKVSVTKVHSDKPTEHEVLGTRMALFYHILRQAFDIQRKRLDKGQRSAKQLVGWDFRSLASQKDSSIRVTQVTSEAKDWLELTRVTGAITFFGNNFGELIRPVRCQPLSLCNYWQMLPSGKHYIAITTQDLRDMSDAHELDISDPSGEIVPGIIWAGDSADHEGCANGECKSPAAVQTLVPIDKYSGTLLSSERIDLSSFENGAFVFGNNEHVMRYWDDAKDEDEISVLSSGITLSTIGSVAGLTQPAMDSGYESMDTATNKLSRMSSEYSQPIQWTINPSVVGVHKSLHSMATSKIYEKTSFEGGGSHHLGDIMGSRFENCHFIFQQGVCQQQHGPESVQDASTWAETRLSETFSHSRNNLDCNFGEPSPKHSSRVQLPEATTRSHHSVFRCRCGEVFDDVE